MSIPNEQFRAGMHAHQIELFAAFDQRVKAGIRTPQFFHAEWHRRARKTTGALNLNIKEACRFPRGKYGHIAPTQVMARNIVWDDPNMLQYHLPDKREMGWKLNEQKMLVTFENGSIVKIGGSDEPDSWRGTDFIGVTCDEWSLMKEQLWSEILRPVLSGPLPPHLDMQNVFRWSLFLYTPKGVNHATRMFDNACCIGEGGILPDCGVAPKLYPNTYASRLDGELAGILTQSELNRMKEEVARGEIPQAFYDQEIKCSRVTSEEMTLITTEMIYSLNQHHEHTTVSDGAVRKIVSIDPAWGGDVCKIMGMVNRQVKAEKSILDRQRTSEICMAAKLVAQEICTKNFIVDTVNAPGVADGLSEDEADYNVQRFKSSHKAKGNTDSRQAVTYANRRAEAYGYAARLIRTFEAGPIKSKELIRQLPIASRYKTQGSSGRLIILPKEKIKQELGCSPDEADTYIMGQWGLQFVEPEQESRSSIVDFSERCSHLIPDSLGVGV